MHTRATVSPTEFDYISLTFLAKRISHICTHTHTQISQGFVIFSSWMVIENSAYRQGVYIFVVRIYCAVGGMKNLFLFFH